MKENEEKNIGVVVPEKEYALLNKLVRNMKLNVESRSRSPEWLVDGLNQIAQVQNTEPVSPGKTYGSTPKYER